MNIRSSMSTIKYEAHCQFKKNEENRNAVTQHELPNIPCTTTSTARLLACNSKAIIWFNLM